MKIRFLRRHWFKKCETCDWRLRSGDYYEDRSDGVHHRMCLVIKEMTWPG